MSPMLGKSCFWCSEVAFQVPTRQESIAALGPVEPGTGVGVLPATGSPVLPDRTIARTTIAPTRMTSTALAAISTPNNERRGARGAGCGGPRPAATGGAGEGGGGAPASGAPRAPPG